MALYPRRLYSSQYQILRKSYSLPRMGIFATTAFSYLCAGNTERLTWFKICFNSSVWAICNRKLQNFTIYSHQVSPLVTTLRTNICKFYSQCNNCLLTYIVLHVSMLTGHPEVLQISHTQPLNCNSRISIYMVHKRLVYIYIFNS